MNNKTLIIGPRVLDKMDFILLTRFIDKIRDEKEVFLVRGLPGADLIPVYKNWKYVYYCRAQTILTPKGLPVFDPAQDEEDWNTYHLMFLKKSKINSLEILAEEQCTHRNFIGTPKSIMYMRIAREVNKIYYVNDNVHVEDLDLLEHLIKAKKKIVEIPNFRNQRMLTDQELDKLLELPKNKIKEIILKVDARGQAVIKGLLKGEGQ